MKNFFIDQVTGKSHFRVCTPLVASTLKELETELGLVKISQPDIIEWRIDQIQNMAYIPFFLEKIREREPHLPLVATWRTHEEGGMKITFFQYEKLIKQLIESQQVDFVDIELGFGEKLFKGVKKEAKNFSVGIIASYHNFQATPSESEIMRKYLEMMNAGADVCKISVMPQNSGDVLKLLNATHEVRNAYPLQPCIGISMGELGGVTRISGGLFGSNMTFASLEKNSAPGQFSVEKTREMMDRIGKKDL